MRYQPIYDIAEICYRKNITDVILSPGSRCAPLTLAFTRHPGLRTRTISDERSAAFVALGIAQATGKPVAIVCTSGTAALNFGPAIAEAYFSSTPIIAFTADRPAEWIAQHDGQTIHQRGLFGKHVKAFFELPQDYDHADSLWGINRIVNDAINESTSGVPGPVHINAPFREPLYPEKGRDDFQYGNVRVIRQHTPEVTLSSQTRSFVEDEWKRFNNVLIVGGQGKPDQRITSVLSELREKHNIPVVHDIISNLHTAGDTIQHSDLFLGQAPENVKDMLRPDLLITFGDSLISKNLKLFLRKYRPASHWHIQRDGSTVDTFKNLNEVFYSEPASFFELLLSFNTADNFAGQKQRNYRNLWEAEERRAVRALEECLAEHPLTEAGIVKKVLDHLPESSSLHLANSMSVRYGNFVGLKNGSKVRVCANRGTSGIDGSNSTAVGYALATNTPNVLITGDLAFFYDRNAFWHNYPLDNLRILVLNNHGGLIFDILEGPSSVPEAQEYFITRQKLNARKVCEEFGFDYLALDNARKISNLLKDFLTFDGGAKVMELDSDMATNRKVLELLKTKIKNSYEL